MGAQESKCTTEFYERYANQEYDFMNWFHLLLPSYYFYQFLIFCNLVAPTLGLNFLADSVKYSYLGGQQVYTALGTRLSSTNEFLNSFNIFGWGLG